MTPFLPFQNEEKVIFTAETVAQRKGAVDPKLVLNRGEFALFPPPCGLGYLSFVLATIPLLPDHTVPSMRYHVSNY